MPPVALLASRYAQYRDAPPDGPVIAITVANSTGWSYRSSPVPVLTAADGRHYANPSDGAFSPVRPGSPARAQ